MNIKYCGYCHIIVTFFITLNHKMEEFADISDIPKEIYKKLQEYKQEHLVKYIIESKVTKNQAKQLISQIQALNLSWLQKIYHENVQITTNIKSSNEEDIIEPLESFSMINEMSIDEKNKYKTIGYEAIAKGKVAALVLSGGQGTRLGFAGPKGMFTIDLLSKKTLFELFALRILRIQNLVKALYKGSRPQIQWYIMTSPMNHDTTVRFFEEKLFFGLNRDQVFFFPQGTLPSFHFNGPNEKRSGMKIMLENYYSLSLASDGNGGIYRAMDERGVLNDMSKKGVEYIHVFSVDNALCKVVDPLFIGLCVSEGCDIGNKVVWKTDPDENVGLLVKKNKKNFVIEYNEINSDKKRLRNKENNNLVFGAGNICNHFFTRFFLNSIVTDKNKKLSYHVAKKAIPSIDTITNESKINNGIKLEAFLFDVFEFSDKKMTVLAVNREEEFSPVKNKDTHLNMNDAIGTDSPESAKRMISELHKKWIEKAGGKVIKEITNNTKYMTCEISPIVSYSGEGLKKIVCGKEYKLPLYLNPDSFDTISDDAYKGY